MSLYILHTTIHTNYALILSLAPNRYLILIRSSIGIERYKYCQVTISHITPYESLEICLNQGRNKNQTLRYKDAEVTISELCPKLFVTAPTGTIGEI